MNMFLLFTCLVVLLHGCESARILGVVPTPSFSHQEAFRPIWRELLQRGHQITLLTTHPMKDPHLTNLTEIDMSNTFGLWEEQVWLMVNASNQISLEMISRGLNNGNKISNLQFGHSEVQNLINNKSEHFDLLMVELLSPSFAAFSYRFKCPLIAMYSLAGLNHMYDLIGSPSHPVLYPDYIAGYISNPTFFERVLSVVFHVLTKLFFDLYLVPKDQARVAKYFGEEYPPLSELLSNIDLMFFTTDLISGMVRPAGPNVIRIGGGRIQKKSQTPLPDDLQTTLDGAQNGFIYFSLGSTVKGKNVPEKLRTTILETFSELPYTVLWKFELDDLPNKPKNVHISKWYPQKEVLRHPNIKLFITQGGLQSLEEAIYNNVPFLGLPYFADQTMNMKKMVMKGLSVSLDYKNLTKEEFKSAISEIIDNTPKYRQKIIEIAELMQDEPMTGIERAVWWTEYVLRHKGAKHLRSPTLDIPSYQYFLIDVIGFILLVTAALIYLFVKILVVALRFLKQLLKSKKKFE